MNHARTAVVSSMLALALACAANSTAEPATPPADPQPGPVESPSAPAPLAAPAPSGNAAAEACSLFNAALNVSAVNYEDFAYATAGKGDYVNYQDPNVGRTNVIGRTALRQAAAAALSASRTPGLPPEVSDPMRSWSLHATKLLVVMGLHGGGDTLNSSVAELNTIGHDAQMACATKGPAPK